jgi:hypothetical protein
LPLLMLKYLASTEATYVCIRWNIQCVFSIVRVF